MAPDIFFVGQTVPMLKRQILQSNGAPEDLTGKTLLFSMRDAYSATLKVDGATAISAGTSPTDGLIGYAWESGDVDTGGAYRGWWRIDDQETDEFDIVFNVHAPGFGVTTGAIVDAMYSFIPADASMLSGDPRYGDRFLQRAVTTAEYKILGDVVAVSAEAALHPLLIEYLAKSAVVAVIHPIIDLLTQQQVTVTINTGTNQEIASYPDRIKALNDLHGRLVMELAADRAFVLRFVDLPAMPGHFPVSSNAGVPFKTPDPACYPTQDTGVFGRGGGW